jgi:hypothetical protein
MSRAQERSTGLQSGAAQRTSGNVTGTSGNVTGATSTSLRDQPVTRTETSHARSTGTAGYRQPSGSGGASGSGSMGLGGVIAMLAGLLTFFAGLAAVVRQGFYPTLPGYAYRLNVHAWGWILLVLGVLLFAAGASHLLRIPFGRLAGVGLALLTAIAAFMFLAYSPIWGTILVALSALAIWGLLRRDEGEDAGGGGSRYGESSMGSGAAGTTGSGVSAGTTGTTAGTTGTTSTTSTSARTRI